MNVRQAMVFDRVTKRIKICDDYYTAKVIEYPADTLNRLMKLYSSYMAYCKTLAEYEARMANVSEGLTEHLVCFLLDLYKVDKDSIPKKLGKSFDAIHKDGRLVQIKATTVIKDCTTFGPESEFDVLYFVDLSKKPHYDIYDIDPRLLDTVSVNKKQTFNDQQKEKRRPRFSVKKLLIDRYFLTPIACGTLEIDLYDFIVFQHSRGFEICIADFYCGVGGFSKAFEDASQRIPRCITKTVFAIDFDARCKETFDLNSNIPMTLRDINSLRPDDIPYSHIYCAGFNCQPFSVAGKRLGFEDNRTDSLEVLFDIVRTNRPACVFIENVKGLLSHDGGQSFERILKMLRDSNYTSIFWKVMNTCEYTDIPQNRERLFIVAFCFPVETFDFPKPRDTSIRCLSDFLEDDVPQKYYYTENSPIYERLVEAITDDESVYQYRRGVVRKNASGVVPALVATMGTGGHNVPIIKTRDGIRKLTPRECFNLQGFPDCVFPQIGDAHLYKQAGNGITVTLVSMIAEVILEKLIH